MRNKGLIALYCVLAFGAGTIGYLGYCLDREFNKIDKQISDITKSIDAPLKNLQSLDKIVRDIKIDTDDIKNNVIYLK